MANGRNFKCKLRPAAIINSVPLSNVELTANGWTMKISSGWSKGLKILTPDGLLTRPTRERVRQSAINMLQPWIAEARVLDLFAGSGAVGIELVSRGASGAVFAEMSVEALKCLRVNASEAKLRADKQGITLSQWAVQAKDAYILVNETPGATFDLIWADPPYEIAKDFLAKSGAHLRRILSDGGIFALESASGDQAWLSDWGQSLGLQLLKQRVFGVSSISVWQKS